MSYQMNDKASSSVQDYLKTEQKWRHPSFNHLLSRSGKLFQHGQISNLNKLMLHENPWGGWIHSKSCTHSYSLQQIFILSSAPINADNEATDTTSDKAHHLVLDVHVVIHVPQTSLLEARGHFLDITAQVFQQLDIAITGPEAQFALSGQMDGVNDVLVPVTGGKALYYI